MGKLQIELQGATERLNGSLNTAGYEVKIGHRNNYSAIDLYKHPELGMIDYIDAGLTDRQAVNIIYAMCKACELLRNPRVTDCHRMLQPQKTVKL